MPSKRDCWPASAPAILAILLLWPRSAATAAQTELRGDISRDGFALVRRALSRDAAAALRAPVLAAIAAEAAVCSKCSPADLASVDNAECFSCDHSWRDGGDGSGPRAFVRARRLEVREPIQLGAPLVFNRDLARLAATALGATAVLLYDCERVVGRLLVQHLLLCGEEIAHPQEAGVAARPSRGRSRSRRPSVYGLSRATRRA